MTSPSPAPSSTTLREPRIDYEGLVALRGVLREAQGARVFVIQGESARHTALLEPHLRGLEVQCFCEARRHVPRELVERASAALAAFGADTVLSVGGGSTTGLGKALRLERSFHFVCVPTTYAGSELTNLYGVTSAAGKQTGRDPRVVPDVVLYDVELTLGMPARLAVTSLLNALAHPVSALSTGALDDAGQRAALQAAAAVHAALAGLLAQPGLRASRLAAFEATVLAGRVLARFAVGLHHRLAHLLGGRFDLDHANLHSVLLPHTLDELSERMPDVVAALCAELGDDDPPARWLQWLARAGASTSLQQLGVAREALDGLLAAQPTLPRSVLEAAHRGVRRASR